MDAGVGSFVFSNAIVSKTARQSLSVSTKRSSISKRVSQTIRSVSPLLILGFIRLYSTKATDYQV